MIQSGAASNDIETIKDQIEEEHATVDMLASSAEQLRLRAKMLHDPVSVISPAHSAVRVSPNWGGNLLRSSLIGLVLGLAIAGVQLSINIEGIWIVKHVWITISCANRQIQAIAIGNLLSRYFASANNGSHQ